jgi:hypothetical protein
MKTLKMTKIILFQTGKIYKRHAEELRRIVRELFAILSVTAKLIKCRGNPCGCPK